MFNFNGVVSIARPTCLFSRSMEAASVASDWEQLQNKFSLCFINSVNVQNCKVLLFDYSLVCVFFKTTAAEYDIFARVLFCEFIVILSV